MPFGGWFDDYYTKIYKPAIEGAGLEAKRADDLYRPSTIVHDIWSFTKRSKLVLADLSGKNPNVFYELGLAHALAKPAILVVENMDDVPFDLRALRVISYDKNLPYWGEELRKKIGTAIGEVLEAPVQSVLPAFLDVKDSSNRATVTQYEKDIIGLRQDLEMLRREVFGNSKHTMSIDRDLAEDPVTAEQLIFKYLDRGLSEAAIIRRLSRRGVPVSWVADMLGKINAQRVFGE